MKRMFPWLLLALLASCGPNPKAPVQVMAIVPSGKGNYETRKVELTTVGNITAFKGSLFNYVGGTRIVMDPNDPLQNAQGGLQNQDDATRYEVLVKDKGMDVRGNFIERGGVLWPADFHTWNMVSTYYNLERAYLYWQELYDGKPTTEIEDNRVLYWSDVKLNGTEVRDNALYLSFVKSFVIVPFETGNLVPLSMNLGVMAHEFSHRVYNTKVMGGAGIHPALTSWNGPAFNLFKSLDEGLADFHGFGATCSDADGPGCRANFLAVSIADESTVNMRDVSRTDACMDANTRSAYLNFSPDQWVRDESMYRVGNLFAAALYQAGNNPSSGNDSLGVLQKAVLTAYDDDSSATPGLNQLINQNLNTPAAFTLESVSEVLVSHTPAGTSLRKNLCDELSARLQLSCTTFPCAELPSCPSTTSPLNSSICPRLP